MKTSIIIPFLNEEMFLTKLLPALNKQSQKDREYIFVNNGSSDKSNKIISTYIKKNKSLNASLISEKRRGFSFPLNAGVKHARGENIIFIDADTLPLRNFFEQHEKTLTKTEISVGNTQSKILGKLTNYGRVSCALFNGHSERAAKAIAHSLPWGPTCNLGIKKATLQSVGTFSSAATGAMDIDWCWRAVLAGNRIHYTQNAKLLHYRRNSRKALIEQFDRYGRAEAWLHKTYSFLTDDEAPNPLESSLEAFQRIRNHSEASYLKNCRKELEEVAVAFASGVRAGYEASYKKCSFKRKNPRKSIGWPIKPTEWIVYVPRKGVVNLSGDQLELWKKMNHMKSVKQLSAELKEQYHLDQHTAQSEAREFWEAFHP